MRGGRDSDEEEQAAAASRKRGGSGRSVRLSWPGPQAPVCVFARTDVHRELATLCSLRRGWILFANDKLVVDPTSSSSGVLNLMRVGPMLHVRVAAFATAAAFTANTLQSHVRLSVRPTCRC